ncbi:SAM-dependent methyltransferase [Streptomyces prunicolor]|uniref:SAM-dependent methyltransferase n=1 Tax=Streptomyces prunicolor TaxID=67348 RepID=UPI000378EF54|nr:SAM-dependent methyltransferase [Streptomyces prunicolor]
MTDDVFDAGKIDTSRPHPARLYDFYLGGKDNYPADWAAAEQVELLYPDIKAASVTNRDFMHCASRMLARQGIRQFLDIGTGIPTVPNLHQVVQEINSGSRVVYVDNDPIVLRHAEALLYGTDEGCTEYISADFREPEKILQAAKEVLDFSEPIALSLVALLHFVSDDYDPQGIVRQLLEPMAAGSHLVISHATGDFDPEAWEQIVQVYRNGGTPAQVRSRDEVAQFFAGLEVLDPGVVVATQWQPGIGQTLAKPDELALYVGVARKA